jgi:hypothetical protein
LETREKEKKNENDYTYLECKFAGRWKEKKDLPPSGIYAQPTKDGGLTGHPKVYIRRVSLGRM